MNTCAHRGSWSRQSRTFPIGCSILGTLAFPLSFYHFTINYSYRQVLSYCIDTLTTITISMYNNTTAYRSPAETLGSVLVLFFSLSICPTSPP